MGGRGGGGGGMRVGYLALCMYLLASGSIGTCFDSRVVSTPFDLGPFEFTYSSICLPRSFDGFSIRGNVSRYVFHV